MMHSFNRDLLVLSDTSRLSPEELNRQMDLLNQLLYHLENWATFCSANEILDIHRHKIIRQPHLMERVLRHRKQKPFVFTCNKN